MPPPAASELSLPRAPDAAAVARLRDGLAAAGVASDDGVLVAVSGGADSVALLLMAQAACRAGRCHAATVDHGLRPAAGAEAAMVARLCAALGVPHRTLRAPLPARSGRTANVSARARDLRYALLEAEAQRVGAAAIATAHHADDQVETLAMRLNRGAGVGGLAGIRARQGRIVRPLLDWRRAELAAVVAACGVVPVDDPSNADDRYDRARLRKALAAADWIDVARWGRSAAALAEAEAALEWACARAAETACGWDGATATLDARGLPAELVRRLVRRCIALVDPAAAPRGPVLARLIARLVRGESGTVAGVRAGAAADGVYRFTKTAPHRSF